MSVWSELSGPWGLGAEETVALVEKAIRSCGSYSAESLCRGIVLGPKLFFVTGLVIFAIAVARLVCPDLLG